jgi:hypothetical protein
MRRRFVLLSPALAALPRPIGAESVLELVMFERAGCSYCRAWLAEIGPIYPRSAEGRLAPLRRVDIARSRPPDLAAVSGIVHTPTFVLRRDGQEVGRITGYPGEAFFWGLLGNLLRRAGAEVVEG